jgi:hypothetical protein
MSPQVLVQILEPGEHLEWAGTGDS